MPNEIENQSTDRGTPALPVYQIPAPEPFTFKSGEEWENWKSRFKRFRSASGLINKSQEDQVNSLIYLMGSQAEPILQSFKLTDQELKQFDTVMTKFDTHFVPTKNVIYERVRFHTRKQAEGEAVEDFVTDLHAIAQNCAFPPTFVDEAIRDQVVVGILDKKLSEKLQLNPNLTLETAVTSARQSESVKRQQEELRKSVVSADKVTIKRASIKPKNRTTDHSAPKSQSNKNNCTWCGGSIHPRPQCPARNSVCYSCKHKGHFSKMCRLKKVNEVKDISDAGSNTEDAFIGHTKSDVINNSDKWHVNLKFCDRHLVAKIDTGADVCVMPETIYSSTFHMLQMTSANKILTGPSGAPLRTLGVIQGDIKYKNKKLSEQFYVVSGAEHTLISGKTSEKLRLVQRISPININPSQFDPVVSFPELFSGLGKTKTPYHIKLQSDAEPYALNVPRRVPLPLKEALKQELDRMAAAGVIEKVDEPTDWCAGIVLVPKPNKTIRVCVDLTKLNKYVQREKYPIPSVEYTLGQLEGAKVFTKLDANSGFWQIPLTPESSLLTTFITPFGRFKFLRLPFGISSAPEVFQKRINELLEGQEGVICHFDDIIVFGQNESEHDNNLKSVLTKLKAGGWTLNKAKCEFKKTSIKLLGHVVNEKGILPEDSHVKAILELSQPNNITELKRLLGIVNFVARFVPHLATIAQPLYELLRNNTEWFWGPAQNKAFCKIKEMVANAPCLALYSPHKETIISADSSSYGLGAVLLQRQEDGSIRPVAYASRSLSVAEKNYPQIEKEATALAWSCDKFSDYITGIHITLETDHKPLVSILSKKELDEITPRLQRIRLRLMRYSYQIKYTPGKELIIADTLSRSPIGVEENELSEEVTAYVQLITSNLPASDARLKAISEETQKDAICLEIIKYCLEGWPSKDKISQECIPFWQFRNDISLHNGYLMKGTRIIIPTSMRQEILQKLHEAHQGISKCRELAKQSVWWPCLSTQLEEIVRNCSKCISTRTNRPEPLLPTSFPDRPWQIIGMDLFKLNNAWYLIISDYYSRYPEIAKLERLTTDCVMLHVKSILARHGVPEVIRADNGSQFIDLKFKNFAKDYGFQIVTSSPLFSQSNGFIESQVKNIKTHLKKAEDPYKMLLTIRSTPLENGFSPTELLMGRKIRGVIPISSKNLKPSIPDQEKLKKKEEKIRERNKENYDNRHQSKLLPELPVGQKVYITDRKQQGTIIDYQEAPRSYIVQTPSGQFRRNRKFLHSLVKDMPEDSLTEEETSDLATTVDDVPERFQNENGSSKSADLPESSEVSTSNDRIDQSTELKLRRSQRTRKPVQKLDL